MENLSEGGCENARAREREGVVGEGGRARGTERRTCTGIWSTEGGGEGGREGRDVYWVLHDSITRQGISERHEQRSFGAGPAAF